MVKGQEPRSLIYEGELGNSTFAFHVEDGRLRAVVTKDGRTEKALLIRGIPNEWQNGLNDEEKIAKIQQVLSESFFTYQGMSVIVNPRGDGGWDERQHLGYEHEKGLVGWCLDIVGINLVDPFNENREQEVINGGRGAQGTFQWAIDVGLIGQRKLLASRLAYCSNDVDRDLETNPVTAVVMPYAHRAQGWHFNTKKGVNDGSKDDSRFEHALDQLTEAVRLRKKEGDVVKAIEALGKGLHPLQDIFAHIAPFVAETRFEVEGVFCYRLSDHLRHPEADDPYVINENSPESTIDNEVGDDGRKVNQRYSDTKTVSYIYLLLYRLATEPGFFNSGEYYRLMGKLRIKFRIENFVGQDTSFTIPMFFSEVRNRLEGLADIPADDILLSDQLPVQVLTTNDEKRRFVDAFYKAVEGLRQDVERYRDEANGSCRRPDRYGAAELPAMREFSDLALQAIVRCQTEIEEEREQLDEQRSCSRRAVFLSKIRASLQELRQYMSTYKARADGCCRSKMAEKPDMRSYSASAVKKIDQCLRMIETQSPPEMRSYIESIKGDVNICKTRAVGCRRSHVAELPDMRVYSAKASTSIERCLSIIENASMELERSDRNNFISRMQEKLDSIRGAVLMCRSNAYGCCSSTMAERGNLRLLSDSAVVAVNQCREMLEKARVAAGISN